MTWQLILITLCSGIVALGGRYALLRIPRDMIAWATEEMERAQPDTRLAACLTALGCLSIIAFLPVTFVSFVMFSLSLAALVLGPWS